MAVITPMTDITRNTELKYDCILIEGKKIKIKKLISRVLPAQRVCDGCVIPTI